MCRKKSKSGEISPLFFIDDLHKIGYNNMRV